MYTDYEYDMDGEELFYEPTERTSDIQLPPVMNFLLLTIWAVISLKKPFFCSLRICVAISLAFSG